MLRRKSRVSDSDSDDMHYSEFLRYTGRSLASPSRSRSPRRQSTITDGEKNSAMGEFAHLYACNDPARLAGIRAFRSGLLNKVREGLHNVLSGHAVFYDDLLRMSEVIFRDEPIDDVRASSLQYSIAATDRRLLGVICDQFQGNVEAFDKATAHHRVSAVHLALRLETGAAAAIPNLPDARTLMNLLAWRSELDLEEEVREIYSLASVKLRLCGAGACVLCRREFEVDLLGVLEDEDELADLGRQELPFAVPKIVVPPCQHAMHALCWCADLVSPEDRELPWGHCRECRREFDWLQLDIRILQKVFRYIFCNYLCRNLDREGTDLGANMSITELAQLSSLAATICTNFQNESNENVIALNEWHSLWNAIGEALPSFTRSQMGCDFVLDVTHKLTSGGSDSSETNAIDSSLPCSNE